MKLIPRGFEHHKRRAYRWGFTAVVIVLLADVASAADVRLSLASTNPARAHLFRAGSETTFVLLLRNDRTTSRIFSVNVALESGSPEKWNATLSEADEHFRPVGAGTPNLSLTVPGRQTVHFLARMESAPDLAEGTEGQAVVTASSEGLTSRSATVRGRIENRPKIYYVALDAVGRDYLRIASDGNWYDGSVDRLMPESNAFLEEAAFFSRANGHLPATTDANHTAALTGSWPGTLGIFSVKSHYMGLDAGGVPVIAPASKDFLRFGLDGQPIRTIFDLAKEPAEGGAPDAFNALVSGKVWVTDVFSQSGGTVDLLVNGLNHPGYVPRPQRYRLADPESDPDAATDREGTNLGPLAKRKLKSWQATGVSLIPTRAPEDRWIASAALRIIAAEDPDVLYVLLAESDTAQHIFGAADVPEEWDDNETKDVLWDDVNVYNRSANRDPVLDVVHEADFCFGLLVDSLKDRGAYHGSYVVLLSDHGQTTVMHSRRTVLDVGKILAAQGIEDSQIERLVSAGQLSWIALADLGIGPEIEAILESHEEFHPALRQMVKPFVVLNREEMESGIDNVEGPYAHDGVIGNLRGELYSAWSIDVPSSDNSKVRWPDLMLFTRHHFQTSLVQSALVNKPDFGTIFNGHHAAIETTNVVLAMRGPGILPGSYDQPASLSDIAPTLYRLLGISTPDGVDGQVLENALAPK